jgi:hypothetical protein
LEDFLIKAKGNPILKLQCYTIIKKNYIIHIDFAVRVPTPQILS